MNKELKQFIGYAIQFNGLESDSSFRIISESYGMAYDAFEKHCEWNGMEIMAVIESHKVID